MKVVILAAGAGSRLGNQDLPKPLTLLSHGQSILEMQLSHLSQYISLNDVFIVVGFHKEQIVNKFPNMHFIENPEYASENTSKSLLKAIKNVDDDVLWINGDVVFNPFILEKILKADRSSMIVNVSDVDDEGVKYWTNDEGQILEVSKEVKQPYGEALGINFFIKEELPALKKNLEQCKKNDYFEKAIEMCIQQGIAVWSIPVKGSDCTEVDFPEDLKKANELLKLWSKN